MQELKSRLVGILEYIEQTEKLKRKPAFIVPDDIFSAYQSIMKGLPGVEFNLQHDGDDLWLRISRLTESPCPEPNETLKPWIILHKSPEKKPDIKNDIFIYEGTLLVGEQKLEEHPEIQQAFVEFVDTIWFSWATIESPRRKSIGIYNKLFTVQRATLNGGTDGPIELVWGIGCALWKKPDSSKVINHPLITQGCEIHLNSDDFSIEVRPRDVDAQIELDCYDELEINGVAIVENFWKANDATSVNRVSPFENSTFEGILKYAVSNLDSAGRYLSDQLDQTLPPPSDKLLITDGWVIFARKKSEHIFIDDIIRLKEKIEETSNIQGVMTSLVEYGNDNIIVREPINFRGLSSSSNAVGTKELYFPMPFNDEQLSIIKKLESNDAVVVQGPPGTGKTHTIANVICHFLAQGKKVLVTAKGDSALAVLQEKIPDEIRHLTVALLSDERGGMKQFERSIQSIANQLDSFNPATTESSITQLEVEIDLIHSKLALIDQKIKGFADKHMTQLPFQGREVLPEELAKFVLEHEEEYSWFIDDISIYGKQLGFGDSDIAGLKLARRAVMDDLPYLNNTIPSPDSLPRWDVISALHNEILQSKKIKLCIDRGELLALKEGNPDLIENAKDLLKTVDKIDEVSLKISNSQNEWVETHINTLRSLNLNDPLLSQLFELLQDISKLDFVGKELLSFAIELPSGTETNQEIFEAITRLSEGKRAFILPIGSAPIREKLTRITIRGFKPCSREEWFKVIGQIKYLTNAKKLIHQWNAIAKHLNLPLFETESVYSFNSIVGIQNHIVELSDFVLTLGPQLKYLMLSVFGITINLTEYDSEISKSIHKSLSSHLDRARLELASNQLQELLSKLEGYTGVIATDLSEYLKKEIGVINSDELVLEKRWNLMIQELKRLTNLKPHLREIERVATLIENLGALHWAQILKEIPADDDNDPYTPSSWLEALNWRAAKSFIEKIDGHQQIKTLFNERKQLESNLGKGYRNLVAQKTWLGVFLNSPDSIRQALQAYLNAIQAMGAGTGVRAVRYRRNARDAMSRAYRAVPCWILPHWRVSETLPAELGLFDLVIVDEASQSDIWALPCLLRGKKLLIVGDDKQVSPSAVGMKETKIVDLVNRSLKNQPHGDQMTPDRSIYDLAKVVFAGNSVTLKEHFRCVPPIIEFSKEHFYKSVGILPLRIPKNNERLDPPLIDVFVKGGYRKGDLNPPEARAIVNEIKEIIVNPILSGRTIGVVTLIGTEQAKYIWSLLNNEIDQTEIVERMIEVGSPPVFQGRERDIILLSNILVKGNRSAANKLEIEQRLNVAMTRARDRMYLFRSVDESDFGPDTLTAKTIRHFTNPYTQDVIQVASLRELCESEFEREMFDVLVKNNYRVKPQVKCGGYRLDFVIEGSEGRRLAVECDGDKFHGPGQWMADMNRQRVLERIGWTFWRCFASSFVLHRDDVTADLFKILNDMGIEPLGSESIDNTRWSLSKTVDPYGHDDLEEDQTHIESTTSEEAE